MVDYEEGEVIVHEGDASDCAFVIMHGEVGLFKRKTRTEVIKLGTLRAGDYLGELGILSGRPRSAKAIALTSVKVVKITPEMFRAELKKCPTWIALLVKSLATRLSGMDELLISSLAAQKKELESTIVLDEPTVTSSTRKLGSD